LVSDGNMAALTEINCRLCRLTGSETWERLETCDPKPSARTQLAAVTFNVPLFTTKNRAAGVRSKQSFSSSAAVECSTAASIGGKVKSVANKSRAPLFALRNRGYHLVNGYSGHSCLDDEQPDDDKDANHQPTSIPPTTTSSRASAREDVEADFLTHCFNWKWSTLLELSSTPK